ncbi:uncharacterized protein LOC123558371 [Mercenaria mercenaria]|uniref:uncharacterized protein LOC123558371 n=1 Tax=Mercenaria mercenaria TaxID=6596 RepID=UPI00234E6031|nr:uncharacterized protein LOC123558371 [Mercenaria mercenaria]
MATADAKTRIRLFRLQTLIIDGGLLVLRNILDQNLHIQNISLTACLNTERPTIRRLQGQKTITQVQYDLLYPPAGGQLPSTADFDITLIICLLRNLKTCGLNTKFKWNVTPQATDTSTEADVLRLKHFRNEIAHISKTTGIDVNTFFSKWTEIEQVLLRLNSSAPNPDRNLQQTIDDFKSSSLDPEAEERIEETIKRWQEMEKGLEADVQLVKAGLKEVKQLASENTRHIKENTRHIKENTMHIKENTRHIKDTQSRVAHLESHLTKYKDDDPRQKHADVDHRSEAEQDYKERKKQLKDELVAFYRTRYSTIPLSPLFEEQDTPLVDFYILPEMNLIEKKNKTLAEEETKTPVKSLSDVFKSEKSSEIYLTADAGYGKTAFSKYLAVTWCQAHCPEKEYTKYFKEDAIKAMRGFEFLFLVLLRDSSDDCSIDDLIVKQIVQNFSRPFALTIESIQEIMHQERYLIILDGIDEWIHPEKKCSKLPKTIPHRNVRKKCAILTTTRPWKLGVLNLKTSEIDKKVELVKLNSESAQILEERAISKMKNLDVDEAKILAKQLNEKIKENKLEDLESVPLLTMYLICLWCDDIPLGHSKCGLYASIIELLLSRTISKHPEVELTCKPSQSVIPQCFSEHEHCTKYCTYLKALGKLAFETLFSETKESILVFNKSVADKYLSPNDLKLSLYSGLLTQSTEKTLTKQISKLSFSHKTIQEFFCALYISCQNESDVKEIFLKECKSLQSILDMSTVFVFISGMNAEIISSISRNFMSVISEDKRTSEYRTTFGNLYNSGCQPLEDIQDMYISCMKENTSDKELKICCQDFFFSRDCKEEKYFNHLTQLSVDNKNNMASINIVTRDGRSLREINDRWDLVDPFNINKIYYCGYDENAPLPVLLNKSTKCLYVISRDSWSREMLKTLQNNSLLQAIYIYGFKMSHDVLNDFLNYIINRKTMTEIRLGDLSCAEHWGSCSLSLDFCQHSDLRKLELGKIPEVSQLKVNSQVEHVVLFDINLGEMSLPPGMGNIKHVELWKVNMSASTLRDLVKVVEKLSHKVTVTIYVCKIEPKTEFEHVKQYIRSSQNLRVTEDVSGSFVFETEVES